MNKDLGSQMEICATGDVICNAKFFINTAPPYVIHVTAFLAVPIIYKNLSNAKSE